MITNKLTMFFRDGSNLSEHFFAYSYMAGDSINGKTLVLPSAPFYQEHYTRSGVSCDAKCLTDGCSCTHVEKIPKNVSGFYISK